MIKRTRWTHQEIEAIIHEARLFEMNSRKRLGIRRLIEEAQKVLPEHRQRDISRLSSKLVLAMTARINEGAPTEPVAPPAPEVTHPSALFGLLADQLIDLIAARVVDRLRSEMPGPAPTFDPWTAKKNLRMRESLGGTHKARRTGVLIIGLLPAQASTISATFAPHLDLSFRTPEEALKQEVLQRDHTILMTKFINHSVQDKYRKAKNLHYCNGGVTELVEYLVRVRKEVESCVLE